MTEPLCDESHFMCWPQTGQAYLNSLMADAAGNISHSRPDGNAVFSKSCHAPVKTAMAPAGNEKSLRLGVLVSLG
jgi:hypothetical protein